MWLTPRCRGYHLYFSRRRQQVHGGVRGWFGYDQDFMEENAVFRWYVWPGGLGVIGDSHRWFHVGLVESPTPPRCMAQPSAPGVQTLHFPRGWRGLPPGSTHLKMAWWSWGQMVFRHLGDFMQGGGLPASTYKKRAGTGMQGEARIASTCRILMVVFILSRYDMRWSMNDFSVCEADARSQLAAGSATPSPWVLTHHFPPQ